MGGYDNQDYTCGTLSPLHVYRLYYVSLRCIRLLFISCLTSNVLILPHYVYLNDYAILNEFFEHLNYTYVIHILYILYNYPIIHTTNLQPNVPRSGQALTTSNLPPLPGAFCPPHLDAVGSWRDIDNRPSW